MQNICLYFGRQDTEATSGKKKSGQPMLDLVKSSLTPPPDIYYIAKVAPFNRSPFWFILTGIIVSVNLPLKKSCNNFPVNNFRSSLYEFFYCVHHCNILEYFQGTWLTSVMSLLSPPLLRERRVHIGALCLECFWDIMSQKRT